MLRLSFRLSRSLLVAGTILGLAACKQATGPEGATPAQASASTTQKILAQPPQLGVDMSAQAFQTRLAARHLDPAVVARGRELYVAHCAVCHGQYAQGTTPDWRQRTPRGTFPPPPLDGSAHAWHHSDKALLDIIRDGGNSYGPSYRGDMPPMGQVVNASERLAILRYIQSLWPDAAWQTQRQINHDNPEG